MKTSLKRQDYRQYKFEGKEWVLLSVQTVAIVLFLTWFFYRNFLFAVLLSPLGYVWVQYVKKKKGERRREELTGQFKECILSTAASLQAGYAVENAFMESRTDMKNLYGEDSMIYEELEGMRRGLVINVSLEELLLDFGERSGCEEIWQFGHMFSIAKRGGGNLTEMIQTSANLIGQRFEARREVKTLLAGRTMEQNVMRLMPFGIVFYVGLTYPGFFEPLYEDMEGNVIMTACLILYLTAVFSGEVILRGIWKQMEGQGKTAKLAAMSRNGILGKMARIGEAIYQRVCGRKTGFFRDGIRKNLEILYPEENRAELMKKYYGGKLGLSLLVFVVGGSFSFIIRLKGSARGDLPIILWFLSIAAAVGIFFLMDKDLGDQVKKRRELLRLSYPDLVHGLALYLVAGMTIRAAFGRLGKTNELAAHACREMQMGQSEYVAYEHFGKRAGSREYLRLSALLCQNLKKGTSAILGRLEEEALLSSESRIQSGKRLGEEAETKLLIPMVMLLAVVMLMIMVPAFSMMGA